MGYNFGRWFSVTEVDHSVSFTCFSLGTNMKMFVSRLLMAVCLVAGSLSVVSPARGQDTPKPVKLDLAEGKLAMETPAGWKKVEAKSSMIQYEFRAPHDAPEDKQARITVMQAGGGIQANIDRWKGQFELAKDSDAKVEKKEIAKQTVHMVDLVGTYKESMGGPFAPGPAKKLSNYRMLGLIIETANAGTYFFKMTGPSDVVEKQMEGWKKMAEQMQVK